MRRSSCMSFRHVRVIRKSNKFVSKTNYLYFRIVWPCIVIDSLWIKPTDALSSKFIVGISTLHASGSLSAHHQVSIDTLATEYFQYHPAPGSTPSPNCIKCTNAVVRLRNSWWWAERLPETCRVEIPIIKLELSASVGFIHKKLCEYLINKSGQLYLFSVLPRG